MVQTRKTMSRNYVETLGGAATPRHITTGMNEKGSRFQRQILDFHDTGATKSEVEFR